MCYESFLPTDFKRLLLLVYLQKIQNQNASHENHDVEMFSKILSVALPSNQTHVDQLEQASILERVRELSSEVLRPGSFLTKYVTLAKS